MNREDAIQLYFRLGFTYAEITTALAFVHNIVLSERQVKRILRKLQLFRRKKYTDIPVVIDFIENQINGSGQLHGYRWMHKRCIQQGLTVNRESVREILAAVDPEGVRLRKRKRLVRRKYTSQGPNFLWHMDSYDKLKPYGICINGCIDGFSRKILWVKANCTNSDPKIIGAYYLQTVESIGACPAVIRADRGTENVVVEALQKFFRRNCNDSFCADKSFMYGASHHNQRIESWWSILRKHWTQFWMNHFAQLRHDGLFNGDALDKNILQFCFTKIIQDELDQIVEEWNAHHIRRSRNVTGPSGCPFIMYHIPEIYHSRNYAVLVPQNEIQFCQTETLENEHPCDADLFEMCCLIMEEKNLLHPSNAYEATNVYTALRETLYEIL